jgi:hypothetical protein
VGVSTASKRKAAILHCEDIAAEALEHLITNISTGSQLPKDLKKKIAADIKADLNELAMWDLADAGWRGKLTPASLLTAERNRKLNTPKADQIDELFVTALGLQDVSNSWRWKKCRPPRRGRSSIATSL